MSAAPRDAATVVLVRAAERGPQVWLMRRLDSLVFAPGAYVFPGGSVDPSDDDVLATGAADPEAVEALAPVLGTDRERAGRLLAAAVRETFEECALPLVRPEHDEARTSSAAAAAGWDDAARTALLDGTVTLTDLLRRTGCVLDLARLVPWDRWLTPDFIPRRYDTWFLLTVVGADDVEPRHVEKGEAVSARWWYPAEALAENRAGRVPLVPPTYAVLRGLAAHRTLDDVMAAAPAMLVQRSG